MTTDLDPLDVRGRIIAAFDGSDHAERALVWAAEQAAVEHRPLVVLQLGPGDTEPLDRAVAEVRRTHPGIPVTGHAVPGDPRAGLVDLSTQAHMLVLGSRGRGTMKSLLLGSVSTAVTAHSACPVIVCRPPAVNSPRAGVVVGADATPQSRPVIEFAYRHASFHGLHLTVLHTFWDAAAALAQYRAARGAEVEDPALDDLRLALAESVAGFAEKYPDVQVTLTLRHGLTDEALSPRGQGWDLIVVGRHPASSLQRILAGSVATAVLERSHSTVAVVPEESGA
ncbi:universal stress protein [Nocardioides gilvus]|uniref:universal stress protein n=1 Tax=Nocardioides gilvus TaxID=1735589 RepID=UPI000D74FB65|nr:universal stress protein [Nocardioides gilvus]